MSLAMRKIAFVSAYLACISHGRRLKASHDLERREDGDDLVEFGDASPTTRRVTARDSNDPSAAFANLFLALKPRAAWSVGAQAGRGRLDSPAFSRLHSLASQSRFSRRSPLMSETLKAEVENVRTAIDGLRKKLESDQEWRTEFQSARSHIETAIEALESAAAAPAQAGGDDVAAQIAAKGAEIRELKAKLKAEGLSGKKCDAHEDVKKLVVELQLLKGETPAPAETKKKKGNKGGDGKKKGKQGGKGGGGGLQGMTPRETDFSQWYQDVIAASDLVDQSPVKGCMVIKPYGMSVWESLRDDLDKRIKATGTQNAYFPLFIPVSFLSKEAEHVEGFAKECAVVTHHRLRSKTDGTTGVEPDPEAELEEQLIVRPTSETMIWHMFQKWIQSYRDLPLKVNQWANVVRWEMRTRAFLRSSEFLWQEGHTAHATKEEADETARAMLDVYADVAEGLLALPVIKGTKSPTERFAGADETYTIEALMQNGWALQSGTSHFLGQNFARAFDVFYKNSDGDSKLVWATSWGVSTRLVGALIMTHSDDLGLVLPPNVAPTQVIIVPISPKGPEKDPEGHGKLMEVIDGAADKLKAAGVRVQVDTRWSVKKGPKLAEWEKKGVPLRIEAGPRDIEAGHVVMARRTGGDKFNVPIDDAFASTIVSELDSMQAGLLEAARERVRKQTLEPASYEEMKTLLEGSDGSSAPGFLLVPWHDDADEEEAIKQETKATIRCFPFDEQHRVEGKTCFKTGRPATHMALFARAF